MVVGALVDDGGEALADLVAEAVGVVLDLLAVGVEGAAVGVGVVLPD